MYKTMANKEQSMAVFFICILLAVLMALGFVVYFVWKKYCQNANRKGEEAPTIIQMRQNSRSSSATIDLPTSVEQYTEEEESEGDDETDVSAATNSAMYIFSNEGSRCFRHLKSNSYRQGDLFAHPSSYRQNLSLVGRALKTVEEVEEGMDSPPSYEDLFPAVASSTLLIAKEAIDYEESKSAERDSVT